MLMKTSRPLAFLCVILLRDLVHLHPNMFSYRCICVILCALMCLLFLLLRAMPV